MAYRTMDCKYCPCKFVLKKKNCRWQDTRLFYENATISYFYYSCPRCYSKNIISYDNRYYNELRMNTAYAYTEMKDNKYAEEYKQKYEECKRLLEQISNELENIVRGC